MGTIRIENKGKNIFDTYSFYKFLANIAPSQVYWDGNILYIKKSTGLTGYAILQNLKAPVTISADVYSPNPIGGVSFRIFFKDGTYGYFTIPENVSDFQHITQTYTKDIESIRLSYGTGNSQSIWKNLQIEFGLAETNYEPARQDYLEFDTELFAYNDVADELHDDGTLVKKWKIADLSTITTNDFEVEALTNTYRIKIDVGFSGFEGIRKISYVIDDIVLKADGIPLQGYANYTDDIEHYYGGVADYLIFINQSTIDAETGSTLEDKVINYLKKMTIIYQLATPEIIDLNYDGELILHPGENNLILPDFAVASISGARKYLEG